MSSRFFFFRPILAADRSWVALDWQAGQTSGLESSEFSRCFAVTKAGPLADTLPLVMPVEPSLLKQPGFVDTFSSLQAIFVLPSFVLDDKSVIDRCKQLRQDGYRIGLCMDCTDRLKQVPLAAFDYLVFDAAYARQELTGFDFIYIRDAGFRTIVTSINTHEMFNWLVDKHFDWHDSHFLTARNPHLGKEPDLTRLKLLKLLDIVKQDGDTREIEKIFREEPKLSYNLLRLVNSVAVGARTQISNFSQAIAILGRRQLLRWIQLLIYADNLSDGKAPNPLMQIAAARGRQMEILSASIVPALDDPELADNAFITGLFSLLDVLINLPMPEIVKELPMQPMVNEALCFPGNGSPIGQLLYAIIAGETGNFAAAEEVFTKLGISAEMHAQAQVAALHWAARINEENDF